MDHGFLARVERGSREPSISALAAISEALGADLSVRLYPNTGPRVRDRIQTRIVEELLRIAHPRWKRFTEVPGLPAGAWPNRRGASRRACSSRGRDEVHSQVRRLEQKLGWANLKAESLPSAEFWGRLARVPAVGQLLVIRSTRATRELARTFESTLRIAYPARAADSFTAIASDGEWPGNGLLWADVTHDAVRILDLPPRGVSLG